MEGEVELGRHPPARGLLMGRMDGIFHGHQSYAQASARPSIQVEIGTWVVSELNPTSHAWLCPAMASDPETQVAGEVFRSDGPHQKNPGTNQRIRPDLVPRTVLVVACINTCTYDYIERISGKNMEQLSTDRLVSVSPSRFQGSIPLGRNVKPDIHLAIQLTVWRARWFCVTGMSLERTRFGRDHGLPRISPPSPSAGLTKSTERQSLYKASFGLDLGALTHFPPHCPSPRTSTRCGAGKRESMSFTFISRWHGTGCRSDHQPFLVLTASITATT
nr:hypothetical protein CFP56_12269 [Quercus suber]